MHLLNLKTRLVRNKREQEEINNKPEPGITQCRFLAPQLQQITKKKKCLAHLELVQWFPPDKASRVDLRHPPNAQEHEEGDETHKRTPHKFHKQVNQRTQHNFHIDMPCCRQETK